MISIGRASGHDKIEKVVESALKHPLLDVSYAGAKGALVHVGSSEKLCLGDAVKIGENLTSAFDLNANVKLGARILEDFDDSIEVILIATGVKSSIIESSCGHNSESQRESVEADESFVEDFAFI
jgi:cell division protein FtsZ